jgi:hypothetical protein
VPLHSHLEYVGSLAKEPNDEGKLIGIFRVCVNYVRKLMLYILNLWTMCVFIQVHY